MMFPDVNALRASIDANTNTQREAIQLMREMASSLQQLNTSVQQLAGILKQDRVAKSS